MKIMNYTRREESWLPHLASGSRDDVFKAMIENLCSGEFFTVNDELTPELILETTIARENRITTAMGEGIAFPHARLEGLQKALFAVATFKEPVLFENNPVQIICLILVPASEPTVSLKIMAQLSRVFSEEAARNTVISAQTKDELRDIFNVYNPRIDKPILARDIMRPPRYSVSESDPVSKCSHLMSTHGLTSVPVIDGNREIIGEITIERLFRYGLPDFFARLKSVSFIAEFDPFEKYFEDERNTVAADMMDPKAKTVPLDYTIMEAVFDLAIQACPKLYVTDEDGRWVGTIDKGLVLDNVINH